MKTLLLSALLTVSCTVSAFESANVAELNNAIEQCFQHTERAENGKVRACNTVVRSRYVSREIKGTAFHNRAVIFLNRGERDLALKDFKRALKLMPENEQTRLAVVGLGGATETGTMVAKRVRVQQRKKSH